MSPKRWLSIAVALVCCVAGCKEQITVEKHKGPSAQSDSSDGGEKTAGIDQPASDQPISDQAANDQGAKDQGTKDQAANDQSLQPSFDPHRDAPVGGPVGTAPKIDMSQSKPGVEAVEPNTGELDFAGAHLTVPRSWIRKAPKSTILMAEYSVPRADGDPADGRVTFSVAAGSVDFNVARWRGQFGDKPTKENRESIKAGGTEITFIDLAGNFHDMAGPFTAAVDRPDYRMLAAIFDVNGQQHFIKFTGPAKTVAARAEEFKSLLHSIKVAAPEK